MFQVRHFSKNNLYFLSFSQLFFENKIFCYFVLCYFVTKKVEHIIYALPEKEFKYFLFKSYYVQDGISADKFCCHISILFLTQSTVLRIKDSNVMFSTESPHLHPYLHYLYTPNKYHF